MAPAETAVFREFQAIRGGLLVFLGVVVTALTLLASEHDHHAVFFFRHLRSL
jgi:hypothetical protein